MVPRCICGHPQRLHRHADAGFEGFGAPDSAPCNEWGCRCGRYIADPEDIE